MRTGIIGAAVCGIVGLPLELFSDIAILMNVMVVESCKQLSESFIWRRALSKTQKRQMPVIHKERDFVRISNTNTRPTRS